MSKRIWNHPEVPQDETTVSWRSPGQLRDTKEFRTWMDREFPQGAAEMENQEEMETSRRTFLKLMGSSTALAGFGMVACRRPEAYIVPYTHAPEWVIPGKATYYASSMPRAGGAVPLVVTTFEGRPTKLGANRLHPDYEGTDAFAQASILDLYSTSRSRKVLKNGKAAKLEDFQTVLTALKKDSAAKIGFVFGADESPTRLRLIGELKKAFGSAKFYQYEALTANSADGVKLLPDFANADRIVSLDCDFTGVDQHGSNIAFFNRRKPEGRGYKAKANAASMNRLYSVESAFTLTGGMADHRLRVAPSHIAAVAAQIARELGAPDGGIAPITDAKQLEWIKQLAIDLKASGAKTAVLAGSRQSAAVKQLALGINKALGNIGTGVQAFQTENKGFGDIAALTADLNSSAIETVVMMTPSNPVYDAPADLKFAEAFAKAKTSIHLSDRTNATAYASTWHIPAAHYLESWSDARSSRGTVSIVQPMILPLYPDCVSELELLLAFLAEEGKLVTGEGEDGAPAPALEAVKKTFSVDKTAWKNLLKNGFAQDSTYPSATPSGGGNVTAEASSAPTKESLDVIFATDASVYDGRWIDNGWLQEAPDPVSKLTWDNAVLIAPKTAKELGIYDEIIQLETTFASVSPDGEGEKRKSPMITVTVNGKSADFPVLVSFGQAENTLIIPLGYGQAFNADNDLGLDAKNEKFTGLVGVNRGFDAYPLRTQATGYFATGAKIKLTGEKYPVALTQEHNAMYGRALAREISTDTVAHKGDFNAQLKNVRKQGMDSHAPVNISLYKQEDRDGKALLSDPLHQWAMSIDLSSCMGCNACLVACQSENNIPIVGKEQVAKGREMHWIRMDRYFATHKDNDFDADSPAMVPQPVGCMQCESAPCETVCPVNATVHTEDGLNAMAYNRCIGTRYCANNCPYKARRFNFFDYNKRNPLIKNNLNRGPLGERHDKEPNHLQKNPNVTVRMRGVMEKCTYCVQRLKDAVIRQKRGQKQEVLASGKQSPDVAVSNETLRIPVDSVKTACQDACPAEAISFGNLKDESKSEMGRAKKLERNYDLLQYIGTAPRTSYLARVKNPNPEMPDAKFIGQATINMA
ncbi:MAG: TAT-variant-translocated molybdopterin oxidoreductase [Akkermansiaceae bacterium]|jgi:MoCo/4Fe-4S cofactor protein with predicted Tat translocation signal|nr:TAT-variant-translocated molybdopterin oxidoreductase [Akkermansiaceae bacterium]MDP4647522.1 TAT-variant-translocated molybdopterin oxidoreductase [Akkermansiaceae bacterium]MDP4722467.1 TAT-variant-translocated molybdopterin oxidoreductase [Akkermansiaceae bacterium]MDP4778633.1 TAT-variant-translocated molybdopterin oxidoreductase [Akkermansiaceae bacterium]MDP4899188.1 TAT-variant-translocated molybdopterin oxidoreductase [Akkermansiaceae bacterium]